MFKVQLDAIYTLAEVRAMLKVDRKTVRKWAERIGIPPFTRFFTGEQVRRMATGK